jgi:hypothetical protein
VLDRCGDVDITESVWSWQLQGIRMTTGGSAGAIEAVVLAAAGNKENRKDVMPLLLDRCSDVEIAEAV